ncbi:MAG: hypothetical protein ACOCYE_06015 [Pseudomonadota bacterium]
MSLLLELQVAQPARILRSLVDRALVRFETIQASPSDPTQSRGAPDRAAAFVAMADIEEPPPPSPNFF